MFLLTSKFTNDPIEQKLIEPSSPQIKEIASMELGRRLAVEKELDRNEFKYNFNLGNAALDT